MGRTWDALRRDASVANENDPSRALPGPALDAEPMLVDAEEIPFIEVGPKKSMEASPSVLAYDRKKEQGGQAACAPDAAEGLKAHLFLHANATPALKGWANEKTPAETGPALGKGKAADAPVAPSRAAAPRTVPFHSVVLAAPETEAETPPSDV